MCKNGIASSGAVHGKTDEDGKTVVDGEANASDLAATIYSLLGVDPHLTVDDLSGRPVHIAHGGSPVNEIIA